MILKQIPTSNFLNIPLKDHNNISLHPSVARLPQTKDQERHTTDTTKCVDSDSEKENPQTNY